MPVTRIPAPTPASILHILASSEPHQQIKHCRRTGAATNDLTEDSLGFVERTHTPTEQCDR